MLWRKRRAYIPRRRQQQRLETEERGTSEDSDATVVAIDELGAHEKSRPLLMGRMQPSKGSKEEWGVTEGYADPWRVSLYRPMEHTGAKNEDGKVADAAAPSVLQDEKKKESSPTRE